MRAILRLLLAGGAVLAITGSAVLADGTPRRGASAAAAPVAPASFSWSGFYVGGGVGGAWTDFSHTTTLATGETQTLSFDPSSFAGSVQAGYQVQMGVVVLGLELGLTGFDLHDTRRLNTVADANRIVDIDWLFTVTPRIGFASGNWLVYLKGGYANADVGTAVVDTNRPRQRTGTNRSQEGWTIGTGFETAVLPWVTLGLDYSYVAIDPKRRPAFTQFNPIATTNTGRFSDIDMHLLMARINLRIGNPH